MHCKNHPQKRSKRKCFACKDRICSACTLHVDRHYFCSDTCHLAWKAEELPKRPRQHRRKRARKKARTNAAPPAQAQEASSEAASPSPEAPPAEMPPRQAMVFRQAAPRNQVLITLLALNFVLLAASALMLVRQHAEIRSQGEALRALQWRLSDFDAELVLDVMPESTTATSIALGGLAPETATLYILRNDEPIKVSERYGNTFTLAALPLAEGKNVIQPLVHTPAGARLGAAHIVHRQPPPRPAPRVERTTQRGAPNILWGNRARRAVSFTFDGGSNANAAHEVLDVFRERRLRTTLFLTGEFIVRYPEVVRRALDEGHEIANHTWDHPHLTTFNSNRRHDTRPNVTREWFLKQLTDTADAYRRLTGEHMAPYWRAPYGEVNAELRAWARELGYAHVGWSPKPGSRRSLDSLDWVADRNSPLYRTGPELRDRFVALTETEAIQGGIFLFHLGTQRTDDKIHWELASILDAYQAREFDILPITELIRP